MTEDDYSFVLIKDEDNSELYHPIKVEPDFCNDSFIFKNCKLAILDSCLQDKILIDDVVLDHSANYLIQTREMGHFGVYSVGNGIKIFENQVEVEQDIYHYYFMKFSK
uniref:Uncharacterized protein n=1 Tax=viral metagenome TaxID=1070528 RepID=A0A6C0HXW1_9ZZZZ